MDAHTAQGPVTVTSREFMISAAVAIMAVIIVFGIAGNMMVILAVRSDRKLKTISNIFVVNLSVCDLLFVTCVLPFNIYTYLTDGWHLPEFLCKAVGFLGYTLTGTTLMNITLIAWNRYKLIRDMSGYKETFTNRKIVLMLLVCWLAPMVCLLPALVGLWGKFGYVTMLVTCNLQLNHHSQSFKLFLLLVRAGIPCGMIIYFYLSIYILSCRSHQRMHTSMKDPGTYDIMAQKQELRLTRMMAVIFVVFAISYFPCTITGIIDWNTVLSKNFHIFCQITVYIGSGLNPIIYGLMNSQFRDAYMKLLHCHLSKTPEKLHNSKPNFVRKHSKISLRQNCALCLTTDGLMDEYENVHFQCTSSDLQCFENSGEHQNNCSELQCSDDRTEHCQNTSSDPSTDTNNTIPNENPAQHQCFHKISQILTETVAKPPDESD